MLVVNQVVSPVVIGHQRPGGEFDIVGEVLGTAFSVGGGFLLTAAHVVHEFQARRDDVALVATPAGESWMASRVSQSEALDADIGVIECRKVGETLPALSWDVQNLDVLAPVRSFGSAYGTHVVDDERMIVARAFRGEVTCTLPRFKPIGLDGPAFSVHELSFQAPRGLSGAPLLDGLSETVRGLVIGNSQTEMLLSFETETDSDGLSVERVERLTLGVAVRARDVISRASMLLAGTIGSHLEVHGLLA